MADTPALPRPPVALIASGHEWSTRSMESVLGPSGFAVVCANTAGQALERAERIRPDLVILDAKLSEQSGTELCRLLRGSELLGASTPILMITAGPPAHDQRLDALRAGAWEFFGLPMDPEELMLKLEVYIQAKFEIDRAREESLVDRGTGCYNVRGLLRRAHEMGATAYRNSRPLACAVFAPDISATDEGSGSSEDAAQVSDRLARVISGHSRSSDSVGRLGQAELVVLAPETDAPGASLMARRLADAVEDGPGPELMGENGGSRLQLRAGYFGVTNFRDAAIGAAEMLVRATMALRRAQTGTGEPRIRGFEDGA